MKVQTLEARNGSQEDQILMEQKKSRELQSRLSMSSIASQRLSFSKNLTVPKETSFDPHRHSLIGHQIIRPIVPEMIFPDVPGTFVTKLRNASKVVYEAISSESWMEAQQSSIQAQVKAMASARASHPDQSPQELFSGYYANIRAMKAQLRSAAADIDNARNELKALKEELETEHQLPKSTQDEMRSWIQNALHMCDTEMALSDAKSLGPDTDISEELITSLITVIEDGVVDPDAMVSAARIGRRDILHFLAINSGGREVLNEVDENGHTLLWYAQERGHLVLERWLQDVIGMTSPIRVTRSDSLVRGIPQQYMSLLHQIENTGWMSIQWKNEFTMLHWAANKGHRDLCEYLIKLHADPDARDAESRTALDLAEKSGRSDVVTLLKSYMEY
jgi:hypothetical protein